MRLAVTLLYHLVMQGHTYAFNFNGRIRKEASTEALLQLVNFPLQLSIHDSATNTPLASVTIDMLEFAMGAGRLELGTLQLEPEQNVPAHCAKVGTAE